MRVLKRKVAGGRHPHGDIARAEKSSLCARGADMGRSRRKKREEGETVRESGVKRQEELDSLSSHDSPRICMRAAFGPVEISIRRWLPRGIAYNTIYYGGPPARRNLNRPNAAIAGQ